MCKGSKDKLQRKRVRFPRDVVNIMTRSLGGGGQIMTNHHNIFTIHEDPKWLFRGSYRAFLLHFPDSAQCSKDRKNIAKKSHNFDM